MTKKELIKKLESFKDDSEITLIDTEGNGFAINRFSKMGVDPILIIEPEEETESEYEDELEEEDVGYDDIHGDQEDY